MIRFHFALPAAVAAAMALATGAARGQTWAGPGIDWNTAANWSPQTVPNSPTAAVSFSNTAVGTVIISSAVQAQSLTFSNTSGNYSLTSSSSAATLSGLSTITLAGNVTTVQTINPTFFGNGNLLYGAGGLTITANSLVLGGGGLIFGGNAVFGTAGTAPITIAGIGQTVFNGSFASGGGEVVQGGLTKNNAGILTIGGNSNGLAGPTTQNGGTIILDYGQTIRKLATGVLDLNGGVFTLRTNAASAFTESGSSTTLGSGSTVINFDGNGGTANTVTLALGALTRTIGGTLDVNPSAQGAVTTSTALGTGNIMGGYMTVGGGANWAFKTGSAITAIPAYNTNIYAAGTNADMTTGSGIPAGFTTASLRISSAGGLTATLSGTNTIQTGGILVPPTTGSCTITGGSLTTGGSTDLVVHDYGGVLTIASQITGSGGLTKTGGNILILSNSANNYGGGTSIANGIIQIDNLAQLGTGNITLAGPGVANTYESGADLWYYGPTAATAKTITLGAVGGILFAGTGGTNLTLNGVISEAGGGGKAFTIWGANGLSTVTATAANSYTGPTIVAFNGVLAIPTIANGGVNSPLGASSSSPSNLILGGGFAGGSGTVRYTGGTMATDRGMTLGGTGGSIDVPTAATILTVSGQITGTGGFTKAGGGTLILSSTANDWTGGTTIAGGTLKLGTTAATQLPASGNVVVNTGGTLNIGSPVSQADYSKPIGTLSLNGGTFRVEGGSGSYLLQNGLVMTGGTVDLTGVGNFHLEFSNFNVTTGASSTTAVWTTDSVQAALINVTNNLIAAVQVAAGTTAGGIDLDSSVQLGQVATGAGWIKMGPGVMRMTRVQTNYGLEMTVAGGKLRVDDVAIPNSFNSLTLNGGTLQFGGTSGTLTKDIVLGAAGGTVEVTTAGVTVFGGGKFSGSGSFTKTGPGTLVLAISTNTFTGGLTVNGGVLSTIGDGPLGAANPTVNPAGTLRYTATDSTARTFNLTGGTLDALSGVTVTLGGATVNGGFVHGPGTFALTNGTTFNGVTTSGNSNLNVTGAAALVNVSSGGTMTLSAPAANPTTLSFFKNEGSGSITVAALSAASVADFQSYGTLTINPATLTQNFSQTTLMTNVGTSQLYFNGGSRTFLGTPATAVFPNNWPNVPQRGLPTFVAGLDLNGKNATVAGGLFVNNGYVEDTTNNGQGTAAMIADFGALVKGAGYFQNSVQTMNGGKFQAGNSPGKATFGQFVLGPGGVSNYVLAIDDATGAAGPSPDAAGHVSGWGLVRTLAHASSSDYRGDFTWTATPADKLAVSIETLLNPTTVGVDVAGPMDHFDPTRPYSWPAVEWSGTYAGPADPPTLDASTSFDLTGFANPVGGAFGWALDSGGHTLSLTYTPSAVPEPGTLVLTALAGVGWALRRRRPKEFQPSIVV